MAEGEGSATLPSTIGRYQILEEAGAGAMATIYRAHDPEIDRTIAIKVLKQGIGAGEEDLARFMREARAAGALTHPNIVTIFDVGRFDDAPYLSMELLEGDTLEDRLHSGRTFSVREVLELAIDLARALHYAHDQGVVHRDMKPSNILFAPSTGKAKIADFGIARLESTEELAKTQSGVVFGTPRYMSPEQASGFDTDGRTDLFSLGVMLYEMLTGTKAFDAPTTTSLLLQIVQDQPRSFKDVQPKVPTGLQKVVMKLLAKEPDKRFQTGNELAEALERELEAEIEREAELERNKFVPLRIKWALTMGGIVSLVLLVSMITVIGIQENVIRAQVLDSGSSLARFIATEAAFPVLSEDWIRLDSFVAESSRRDTFEYLVITDHTGTVRASSDAGLQIGEMAASGSQVVTELTTADGAEVFNFDTPILFQDTEVGRIQLGLSREGLNEVMAVTGNLMLVLALVTIAAVVGMLYVFGGLLARPLRRLRRSMRVLETGDLDHRTSADRNDEIGELFGAFNQMAEGLQHRFGDAPGELGKVASVELPPEASSGRVPVGAEDRTEETIVVRPQDAG